MEQVADRSLDDLLGGSGAVTAARDGNLPAGSLEINHRLTKFRLVLSQVENDEAMIQLINSLKSLTITDKVQSLAYSGSNLQPGQLERMLSPLFDSHLFCNVVELIVSFIRLPDLSLEKLCMQLNPFGGGWKVRRLDLTRCNLKVAGTIKLMDAIKENVSLEEIILTGNKCTDECIPALVTCMTKFRNNIYLLGLSSNQLTSSGEQVKGVSSVTFHSKLTGKC